MITRKKGVLLDCTLYNIDRLCRERKNSYRKVLCRIIANYTIQKTTQKGSTEVRNLVSKLAIGLHIHDKDNQLVHYALHAPIAAINMNE